jgi:hypothetical protein
MTKRCDRLRKAVAMRSSMIDPTKYKTRDRIDWLLCNYRVQENYIRFALTEDGLQSGSRVYSRQPHGGCMVSYFISNIAHKLCTDISDIEQKWTEMSGEHETLGTRLKHKWNKGK